MVGGPQSLRIYRRFESKMSLFVGRIVVLCLLSTFWILDVTGKNLKIIIPHKISYIHHHHNHPNQIDTRLKKHFFKGHYPFKHDQFYQVVEEEKEDEESEEELDEEPYEHYGGSHEEEFDEAESGITNYAIPVSGFSNRGVRLVTKPQYLYNEDFQRKKVHRYENYLQRPRLPDEDFFITGYGFNS